MIKILYLDTSAVVKYFLPENGSDFIEWIINKRAHFSISLQTSSLMFYEFKIALRKKHERGDITYDQLKRVMRRSKYYFDKVFLIPDNHKVPNFSSGNNVTYHEICTNNGLKIGKRDQDARHLACVINYLRCFSDTSKPIVLTADVKFGKIIKKYGYKVINPEKATMTDCTCLTS